ncbi:hypothetical protein ABE504_21745 [Paenibacillus oryzisoli]|uniref:hypothetical protein n=1 Tax=Paenibacillus oryzisoli TaxID=1850517 RepID=UPI003D282A10
MTETWHDSLEIAKERMYRYQRAQRRREELQQRVNDHERRIVKLELELEAEQADVERLTKLTLANLFHTILRSKEEQLQLERQQVLNAVLALQTARQALEDTKADLHQVGDDLALYQFAEAEYTALMAKKEASLRSEAALSPVLHEMEEQIAEQSLLVKELSEAWRAGKGVMSSLEAASEKLEKAESWGKWDTWGGGGMISTHKKHSYVDEAKTFIQNANHQLRNFREELKDLQRSIDIQIDISDTLKMADYWFDGLITDWIVQGRIQSSQEQTLRALHQVRTVVRQLQSEHAAADSTLAGLRAKRTAWIEETQVE